MKLIKPCLLALLAISSPLARSQGDPEFPPMPPVQPLSPADEQKTFLLPPGYRMELVLSEPDITEPVAMAFDGNGRLYVAEMNTYMKEIDGKDQHTPKSRVSVHWSSRNDGVFDQHRVFADNLMLPRLLLPIHDGVLIGETDTNDIFLYRDTDGDGVSDEKRSVYEGGPRGGNLEHQPSGLTWGIDNWLYMANNSYRLRWQDGKLIKQDIPGNGGQWGASQDDHGKLWVVNAGGERGPVNFQQHVLYGQFQTPDQFEPDFAIVWPAMGLLDYQGGPGKSRDDNTLNHFTATCGGEIYRGHRLPAELRGNLFFGEPVGRLVRRSTIEVKDGLTILHNPHPKSEFLRSTDACFRPIDMKTAPDGTLFVCDMYRGIIQEGNWTREGSYLRKVILKHGMEKVIDRGRIWRLVHDSMAPEPAPALHEATPAQLVEALAHPNGWQRDTAQKLLVLRGEKSIVPALAVMAKGHAEPLARIHALWTLEGLGALTVDQVRAAMADSVPEVRHAAIRASETHLLAGDTTLIPDIKTLATDSDASVAIQAMLTARQMKWKEASPFINQTALTSASKGVKTMASQILTNRTEFHRSFTGAEKAQLIHGQTIFQELCYTCHGLDGKGMTIAGTEPPLTLAAPLSGSEIVLGSRDGVILAVLHGVTGPIKGKTYQGQMIPMGNNDDKWVADVISYVRNSFGNSAACVTPADVARVRSETKERTTPWTESELHLAGPTALSNRREWKLTASHGADQLAALIDGEAKSKWSSGDPLDETMWITVELPGETMLSGVAIQSNASTSQTRNLRVETSGDGQTWSKPVFHGAASCAVSDPDFAPVKARFVRISSATKADARNGKPWEIQELALRGESL